MLCLNLSSITTGINQNEQGANIYLKKLGGSKQTVLMSGHHNGECDNAINVLNEQKPNISGK